jgi:dihydroneopterin aldolase
MDTIHINDFIVLGRHGLTAKERETPQRFIVDIRMDMLRSNAYRTTEISDTLDYRPVRKLIQKEVGENSYVLIETLVERIATQILETTIAEKVTITLRKADIWNDAVPGICISRVRHPSRIELLDFDWEKVSHELLEQGACSLPILTAQYRAKLLKEAEGYEYVRQPEVLAGGKVREQISSFNALPEASGFHKVADDLAEMLYRKSPAHQFATPLHFNEFNLQRYDKGSLGVTPHKEGKSCRNLIAVFILKGDAKYAICRDRSGSEPIFFDTTPGNVILMRGVGFYGRNDQPMHFVTDITSDRIVFTMRQKQR